MKTKFKKVGLVPRIFDDEGNLRKPPIPLERLSHADFLFLEAWKKHGFNAAAAGKELGLSEMQTKTKARKLAWLEHDDKIRKAKTAILSPEYVVSKDIDNLEGAKRLEDSEHKSLDRLAKIQGMFHTSEVNITQNVFNLPKISPEAEAAIRAIADREADVVEAEVSNG